MTSAERKGYDIVVDPLLEGIASRRDYSEVGEECERMTGGDQIYSSSQPH
jgi:hypothetical protein